VGYLEWCETFMEDAGQVEIGVGKVRKEGEK
jgi:hypothetical protein